MGWLAAAPALAQLGDEEAKQEAAALMDQGNAHYAAQRYDQAIDAYARAHDRYPSPKILLNLAQAESANGRADRAAAHYEEFLTSAQVEARDPQRDSAKSRLESLVRTLGRMVFEDGQPGTHYSLDGSAPASLPEDHLWLVPGRHQLTISREGDEPLSIEVEVNAGQKLPVRARLAPVGSLPPPVAKLEPQPPPLVAPATPTNDGSIASKWWFWAGAAALIAGGVVIALAATTGGDDFVPSGELGRFETTGWDLTSRGH